MALWGGFQHTSPLWGANAKIETREWSRAHTELRNNDDRKKYLPMDHPLARENGKKMMEGHNQKLATLASKELDEEMVAAYNDGVDAKSASSRSNRGRGSVAEAKALGLAIDATKGAYKERIKRGHQRFVFGFDEWLRGKHLPCSVADVVNREWHTRGVPARGYGRTGRESSSSAEQRKAEWHHNPDAHQSPPQCAQLPLKEGQARH
jgi:hypothetical protein